MAITNTAAIRFCNEEIRPAAELLRAMDYRLSDMLLGWEGVASLIPDSADEAVEDGREAEGVSRLTGSDVRALVAIVEVLSGVFAGVGVRSIVRKPAVRTIQIG